jgi:hypothetical protein
VLQSLKRGDTFGGREILNQEVHSHVVTAASNCTLLSVSQADFSRGLTPYFRDKQEQVLGFLRWVGGWAGGGVGTRWTASRQAAAGLADVVPCVTSCSPWPRPPHTSAAADT